MDTVAKLDLYKKMIPQDRRPEAASSVPQEAALKEKPDPYQVLERNGGRVGDVTMTNGRCLAG